ncbi:MAG: type II toxin-antitoxin system RelE/ParE family toxin [Actinobacteria bacterium]|nr:type II toxin-antitoxin system RelE/ParE family toxin [Actinomycetota bacterium]
MRVLTSPTFDRYAKKLHPNEKKTLNKAVLAIRNDPLLGEPKKGGLEGFYRTCAIFTRHFRLGNVNGCLVNGASS